MVDRLVSISEYSNCQDDVDHFLLNLMSSTAPKKQTQQTPNSQETVISGCIDTVLYQQDDNIQQENIIAYICGFIIKKLVAAGIMCVKCRAILEETNNLNSRHLGLIWSKQYQHSEMGGLFKPSLIMTNVVIVFERVFQTEIKQLIKSRNVRKQMAGHLYKLSCCSSLKDRDCICMSVDYKVLMYTTIRLHHELKLMNTHFLETKANKRAAKQQKKNRKLAILQHE